MAEPASTRRGPAPATIALALAALLAIAAIGLAVLRSGDTAKAPANNAAAAEQAGTVEEMIARVEARLRADPDKAEDWRLLGWSYFESARQAASDEAFRTAMARSAAAYRRAAELEPNNAENWSSLGEALQVSMTATSPEARQAFERALRLDPRDARARYFRGVQMDLDGQHQAALDAWLALLRDTPAGAPWEPDLRRTIQQTAERNHIALGNRMPPAAAPAPPATAAIPGPTQEQIASASAIPPSQQQQMGRTMTERLAARLRSNPRDATGWIQLMRSRMVLEEPREAAAALRSALAAFDGDTATQARLRQAARELGVPAG